MAILNDIIGREIIPSTGVSQPQTDQQFSTPTFDPNSFTAKKPVTPVNGKEPSKLKQIWEGIKFGTNIALQSHPQSSSQIQAGAIPFLTGGLVKSEQIADAPTNIFEKAQRGAGVGLGIGLQAVPVAKGTQAIGRGLQAGSKLPLVGKALGVTGKAIGAGGVTTAATEGALFGALGEGSLKERAQQAAVGGVAGGVIGGTFKGLSTAFKRLGGIDKGLEKSLNPMKGLPKAQQKTFLKTALNQPARAKKLGRFLDDAAKNADNPRLPSAWDNLVDSDIKATKIIADKLSAVGKKIGTVKTEVGKNIVKEGGNVIDDVLKQAKERFNLVPKGKGFTTTRGRVAKLSPADQGRLGKILTQVKKLGKNPTINKLDDVKASIDNFIDHEKAIFKQDKLEKFIKGIRGQINAKQSAAAPKLAQVNKEFARLKDIEKELGSALGKEQKNAVTLAKRVLSERGRNLRTLFGKVQKETGEDLFENAMFAKFATEANGGREALGVLDQILEKGPLSGFASGAKRLLKRSLLRPEARAKGIAGGTALDKLRGIAPQ